MSRAFFCLILFALCSAQASPVKRFHLYYGSDPTILVTIKEALIADSLVVIDQRAFSDDHLQEWIQTCQRSKAKVITYFSIGELHSDDLERFQQTLSKDEVFEDLIIDKNETFNSFRVDADHPAWQRWVTTEISQLLSSGVDGIFLDTVDTIDRYATHPQWPASRKQTSITRMIETIRAIKARHPEAYIMQNGGLNMIGETMFIGAQTGVNIPAQSLSIPHKHNPDAVLWENALAHHDDWAKGRQTELEAIQRAGHTQILALGYKAAHPSPANALKSFRDLGFVGAWSTSSLVLHREASISH
ncbi:MAG: endo alpha-1,4 polygalactosaminidase [Verrucomicrobiota bacterium]